MTETMLFGLGFVALLEKPNASVRVDSPWSPRSQMFGNLINIAATPLDSGDTPHVIRLEFELQAVHAGDDWSPERESAWRAPSPREVNREITIPVGGEVVAQVTHSGVAWRLQEGDYTYTFYPERHAINFGAIAPAPSPRPLFSWDRGPRPGEL